MNNIKYLKLKRCDKIFPKYLDVCLLVCTEQCGRIWLGTSKFNHFCEDCGEQFKYMFNMKYKLKNNQLFYSDDIYSKLPILKGNLESKVWIDESYFANLIIGNNKSFDNIQLIPISLAVCTSECGYYGLICEGSPQVCPKCKKQMYRIKTKMYKLIDYSIN